MEKRSKVLTIGASVAMVLSSAALSISSYIGIFDGKQDMDTQEREIATELSSIAFESLGTSRDVIFDCEISDLEERFMPKENYGWSIPAPLPGSNVIHLQAELCDKFTSNDPNTVARFLFIYVFGGFGYGSNSPCSKEFVAAMFETTYERRFADDYEAGLEFTSLVGAYIDSDERCPKTIEELTR